MSTHPLLHAGIHPSWQPLLARACATLPDEYVEELQARRDWLPGRERLFAAFDFDLDRLRHVLFGESPYPRPESAIGRAFHDGAVGSLWSPTGLSKPVNRATSLRHIVKTLLIAEGRLDPADTGQPAIAAADKDDLVDTADELFGNFERAGVLLLNATLALFPDRKPTKEFRYWRDFDEVLLEEIHARRPDTRLILFGKVAERIQALPVANDFPQTVTEHPYNTSFMHNPDVLALFQPLHLLKRRDGAP